jgi:hypothetical protein
MDDDKVQWTIAVSHQVNNYSNGHGKTQIEWTNVKLKEEELQSYRGRLTDFIEEEMTRPNAEWKSVIATGALRVSNDGLIPLIRLCGENCDFMEEFEALLVKLWYMGRAYERLLLGSRSGSTREDAPAEESVTKAD